MRLCARQGRQRRQEAQRDSSDIEVAEDALTPEQQVLRQCADVRPVRDLNVATGSGQAPRRGAPVPKDALCVSLDGFEVHAGVTVEPHNSTALERLCRYLGRGPLAERRLSRTSDGTDGVVVHLKRPRSNGVRKQVFTPVGFLMRLCALVPPPGVHMVRFHGVFASRHPWRAAGSGTMAARGASNDDDAVTPAPVAPARPARMLHADLLRRSLGVTTTCPACGTRMTVIAHLQDPTIAQAIAAAMLERGPRVQGAGAAERPGRGLVRAWRRRSPGRPEGVR